MLFVFLTLHVGTSQTPNIIYILADDQVICTTDLFATLAELTEQNIGGAPPELTLPKSQKAKPMKAKKQQ